MLHRESRMAEIAPHFAEIAPHFGRATKHTNFVMLSYRFKCLDVVVFIAPLSDLSDGGAKIQIHHTLLLFWRTSDLC